VLMRCYVSLGLRDRALRQYRLCEETLLREYGTAPSSETRSLYGGLLRDGSARSPFERASSPNASPSAE
jgi:DNA-binding SARP family transcriptional activator